MSASRILRRASALALCGIVATSAVASAAGGPMPATIAPQNPWMGGNPFSNIHNDTWMTDAYQHAGPLGRRLVATTGPDGTAYVGTFGGLRSLRDGSAR